MSIPPLREGPPSPTLRTNICSHALAFRSREGGLSLRRRFCVLVNPTFRKFGEGLVGLLLFRESGVQELDGLLEAEFGGPSLERAVAGDFIMLDRLRCSQQTGIEGGHSLVFLHDLLAFFKDAHDGVACFSAW